MKTPTVRYPCCEHCIGEGCPRMSGHNVPCGHQGCLSYTSIMEQARASTPVDHAMEDIMGWRDEENLRQQKEDMVELATSILGHEPVGLRATLKLLSHPGMVESTRRYFESLVSTDCLHYEAPWNCARESEAKFENLQYGWMGGIYGDEPLSSWCEPCLSKVMGRPVLEDHAEGEVDGCADTA